LLTIYPQQLFCKKDLYQEGLGALAFFLQKGADYLYTKIAFLIIKTNNIKYIYL